MVVPYGECQLLVGLRGRRNVLLQNAQISLLLETGMADKAGARRSVRGGGAGVPAAAALGVEDHPFFESGSNDYSERRRSPN